MIDIDLVRTYLLLHHTSTRRFVAKAEDRNTTNESMYM
jgi:hypothetical protein